MFEKNAREKQYAQSELEAYERERALNLISELIKRFQISREEIARLCDPVRNMDLNGKVKLFDPFYDA